MRIPPWLGGVLLLGLIKLAVVFFWGKYIFGGGTSINPDAGAVTQAGTAAFPSSILRTRIRRAVGSNKQVSLGRLERVGGLSPFSLGRSFVNLSTHMAGDAALNSPTTRSVAVGLKRDYRWRRSSPQLTRKEFDDALQCAPDSLAEIDGLRGSLALAKLVPVTRDTIRIAAAFVESDSACSPWAQCRRLADFLEARFGGQPENISFGDRSLFSKTWRHVSTKPRDDRTRLVSIVDGVVYTDWPWGAWRWAMHEPDYFTLRLLGAVAEISRLPDAVFFVRNYDYPLFPSFVPVPAFSHAPTNQHSDIPYPWVRAVDEEIQWYNDQLMGGARIFKPVFFSEEDGQGGEEESEEKKKKKKKQQQQQQQRRRLRSEEEHQLLGTSGSGITGTNIDVIKRISSLIGWGALPPTEARTSAPATVPNEALAKEEWSKRRSKAAFYGYLWGSPPATARMVVLDVARRHPELLEVAWTAAFDVKAFSPLSVEKEVLNTDQLMELPELQQQNGGWAGHLSNYKTQKQKQGGKVAPFDYLSDTKYLLVLSGNNGADRLGPFLDHSGAVLLIQENDALSHFSARLRPWVHYVPITHTAADVADKIRWLQEHDDLAYQLAKNAFFFGRSYLRLEDYYCYVSNAVAAIAQVEEPDAKQPFSPAASLKPAFPAYY